MSSASANTTHATGRERWLGHLAMVFFAAFIAGSFTTARYALPYVEPAPLNAMRYALAVAIMAGYMFGIRRRRFSWPQAPWRYAVLGGLMAIYFVTMFVALGMTSPVSTSAVFTLTPLMTMIFGLILVGQKFGPVLVVSLVVAACGSLWVIFGGDLDSVLSLRIGQGEAIFFVGCIAHALFAPLLRKFNRGESQFYMTFFIILSTGVWIALYGLQGIVTTNWLAVPLMAWAVIFYLAIFTGIVTFALMQYASMRLPAAKVMSYSYLVPSFVILYEALSGQGWVTASVAAGALVTGLGLVVLYFTPDK